MKTTVHDETNLSAYLTEEQIAEIEKDIASGKNISPRFDNAEDAIAWLRKEIRK